MRKLFFFSPSHPLTRGTREQLDPVGGKEEAFDNKTFKLADVELMN